MVNTGSLANLTNADQVELTDATASRDWGQLYNVRWSLRNPIHKRTRLDKKVEQYAGLPTIIISAEIGLTSDEITTFLAYQTRTNGQLEENNWDLKCTSKNTNTDTIRIVAMMSGLDFLGPQDGYASFHIELTSTTEVLSEP